MKGIQEGSMIYLSPLVSGRPDYSRSSMKKLRASGIEK
jgi:hypothetical protein